MRNPFAALGDEPTLATATIAVRSDGKIAFAIGNIYFAFLPSDARILADALVKAADFAEKKDKEEIITPAENQPDTDRKERIA